VVRTAVGAGSIGQFTGLARLRTTLAPEMGGCTSTEELLPGAGPSGPTPCNSSYEL